MTWSAEIVCVGSFATSVDFDCRLFFLLDVGALACCVFLLGAIFIEYMKRNNKFRYI